MARKLTLNSLKETVTLKSLEETIRSYISNKSELDSLKKVCDEENAEIKKAMLQKGITEKQVDSSVIHYVVSKKQTMDEDKLLEILKRAGLSNCIKTKEYVDMTMFESMIYRDEIPHEIVAEVNSSCVSTKEIVSLRVTKAK